MNWAFAVVLIVALVCVAEVLKAKYRARHGITTDAMGNEKPLAPPTPRSSVRSRSCANA